MRPPASPSPRRLRTAFSAHPRRVPTAFWVLATLTAAQLAAFLLTGAVSGLSSSGCLLMAVLLVALARGSRTAWTLLVAINAVELLAALAICLPAVWGDPGTVQWSHAAVMLLSGAALLATLASASLRRVAWPGAAPPPAL